MFKTPPKTMTMDEFLAFIEQHENDLDSFELHQGVMIQMPPSIPRQSALALMLGGQILNFVREHNLGFVVGADGGFKLSEEDFYAADVAFFSHERLPEGMPEAQYVTVPPDLAAEVVPMSDQYTASGKAKRYIELGVRLVWVVYPKKQTVDVYKPTDDGGVTIHTLRLDGTFDGGDVLPGFTLPVKKVFSL